MHKHRIAAGAAAVGLGIAGAVIAGSPALAGPVSNITTHIVVATATAAGNNTNVAEATCGAGELLTGGGYRVNGSSTDWRVYVDAPLNGTTWLVEPINFSATPLKFSAYAICAKSVAGTNGLSGYTTQTVQADMTVPTNSTGEADATCPAGELRTGGGYQVDNISSNWSIYLNAPDNNDTWTVEIDNEVSATTTFHAFAMCLANANSQPITGLTVSTVEVSATVPANSVLTATASCPATELMVGGGHVIDSIGPDWSIQASAPTTKAWRVKVADLDTFSRVFDSMAVCLAKA